MVFPPSVLALGALEKASFSFIACPHLTSPEISFSMPAFRAGVVDYWKNISVLVFYDSNLCGFFHLFIGFYLHFAFRSITAIDASEIFPLFNKNTSTFRAKFHVILCLMLVFKCFLLAHIKQLYEEQFYPADKRDFSHRCAYHFIFWNINL